MEKKGISCPEFIPKKNLIDLTNSILTGNNTLKRNWQREKAVIFKLKRSDNAPKSQLPRKPLANQLIKIKPIDNSFPEKTIRNSRNKTICEDAELNPAKAIENNIILLRPSDILEVSFKEYQYQVKAQKNKK